MKESGGLRIDPVALNTGGDTAEIEIVIPYTEWALAQAVLQRAALLTAGLNATVHLVAVHTVPYPMPFRCPVTVHANLVEQLVDLASSSPIPVDPQVILARYQDEGFRHILKPHATVLIGTRKQLWRTREEKLARALAHDGHQVALLHVE